MSGDSPNSHRNEIFDFKDGISPAPTTSKDLAIQSNSGGGGLVQASVLVEPDKEREEDKTPASPIFNNSSCEESHNTDPDETVRLDELSYSKKKSEDKDEKKRLNGEPDKLDGVWIPSPDLKKPAEEDDDNCIVKCLYFTMQCCECTIV